MIYTYEVQLRDIHPINPARHLTVRVAAPSAKAARRVAASLGPLGLSVRGITLQGTLVADKATRLGPWGKGR